ncbi:MAG TPA: ABC transporter substrate-binding protein [Jiangellaceae bacterium]|nr:ABC transporter substrate-binding protein [Jiangellaceae bacterium]
MAIRPRVAALPAVAAVLLLAACGSDDATAPTAAEGTGASADTLRLGYFPNFTHAPALIGVQNGIFEEKLGDVTLETTTFNAGGEAVEAMFAGAIDATFIGPSPTINGYAQSNGEALRVVSGAAANGAYLVVREGIDSPQDLVGKTLATPQLGNTQDVALRYWLQEQGYETTEEGGGDVSITPMANGETLGAFASGAIDGGWLPEPWATRLVDEGGAHVLVDETELWPDGQFVTTQLIVSKPFLEENQALVEALIAGELEAIELIESDPQEAQTIVNQAIKDLTGDAMEPALLSAAWQNVVFTVDPVADSLVEGAAHAEAVGLLDPVELDGLYDLDLLNTLLADAGKEQVSAR